MFLHFNGKTPQIYLATDVALKKRSVVHVADNDYPFGEAQFRKMRDHLSELMGYLNHPAFKRKNLLEMGLPEEGLTEKLKEGSLLLR